MFGSHLVHLTCPHPPSLFVLGTSSLTAPSLYRNYPITIAGKIVSINIEVIDAPLDYNILLGRSYTYAMFIVTSIVFLKMCFPHHGKIVTID